MLDREPEAIADRPEVPAGQHLEHRTLGERLVDPGEVDEDVVGERPQDVSDERADSRGDECQGDDCGPHPTSHDRRPKSRRKLPGG